MTKSQKNNGQDEALAQNRKARHDYEIIDSLEVGIELVGTEVKSCRAHAASLAEAFAKIENGQVFVYSMHIAPYAEGNRFNHLPLRTRRLLLHKKEILKISQKVKERGIALVPLKLFLKNGRVKMELGLAKGKTFGDKRETLRKRQDEMDTRRSVGRYS